MSTITLPNIRVSSDLTVGVVLKDGGVAIDWSTLSNIKAYLYADAQRAMAGRCTVSIDETDSTRLVCAYRANKPQYIGVNRIVITCTYRGETKTYDKPALNFVRWTDDQAGQQITIDDPDVDVEIEVEDVSSSLLDQAIAAALAAAAAAEHAASLIPNQVLLDAEAATAAANAAADAANAAGITSAQVSIADNEPGTPSAEVSLANKVLSIIFHHLKGNTGDAAGFGTITATVDDVVGDPSVTVTVSGPDTAKNFAFAFHGIRGIQGVPGVANAKYKSVDTLPTASAATMDFIYLTPSGTSGVYNMSYTEQDGSTYSWQDLGTTAIQLSDYATKAELSQLEHEVDELQPQVDALMGAFEDPASVESVVADFTDWETSWNGTTDTNRVNVFKPIFSEDTPITKLKIRIRQKSAGSVSLKLASVKVESNNVVDTTDVSDEIVVAPGLDLDEVADVEVVLTTPFTVKAGERLGLATSEGDWLRLSAKQQEKGTFCAVMGYYTNVDFATFVTGVRISSNIAYVNFDNYKVLVLPYAAGEILIKDIPTRFEMNEAIRTALVPVGETTTELATGISAVNGRVDGINRSLKDSSVVSKYWMEKCAHCASIADGGDGYFYVAYYGSDLDVVEGYRNRFLCRLSKVSQYDPTDVTIIDVLNRGDVVGGFTQSTDRAPYDPNILNIGNDTIRYFMAIAPTDGYCGLGYRDITMSTLELGNSVNYCKIKYTIGGTTYVDDATHENLDKMINRYYNQESGGTIGAYPILTTPFVDVEGVIYCYLAGLGAESATDLKDWSGALVKSEDNGITWEVVAWANDLFDARADYPMWEAGIAYFDGKMYILFKFADTPIAYYDLVNEVWSNLVYLYGYYGQGPTIDNSKPCLYEVNGKLYAMQNVKPRVKTTYGEVFRSKIGIYRLTPGTMAKEDYFEVENDAGCQYFSVINQKGRLYFCFTEDKAHRNYQMKGDISIIPCDFLPMPVPQD